MINCRYDKYSPCEECGECGRMFDDDDDYEPDPDREYEEARDNGIWLTT